MPKSCDHPERRPAAGECTAEQKEICHGEPQCENPHLRPQDGNCSVDLIAKCHGKAENHPCK